MDWKLYRVETSGMKNLSEKIKIDFFPLTVDNKSKKNISNVKAIYGTNGSGKSAIVNSVYFYKQITRNSSLLKQTSEIVKLNKIINKEKKEFYFSAIYGVSFNKDEKRDIFKNELTIKFDNNIPFIENEKLSILQDQSINGDYSLIYEVINGTLNINDKYEAEINKYFKDRTLNLLKYSTCTSVIYEPDVIRDISDYMADYKTDKKEKLGIIYYLILNMLFVDNFTVFLEKEDMHDEMIDEDIELLLEKINNIFSKKKDRELINYVISSKKDVVVKSQIETYEKNIAGLCDFLKLFKPKLKNIVIDKREDEQYYYCSKKMVYDGYEVDSDYESTGIQKLMNIYNSIKDVTRGKIVFIDELDANINGVYLNCLVEYINNLKTGQLCFTSHNFYPMEYLYKFANSIDFIGESVKIVSWKKNGNYKPYNQYPQGMIVDSPFNIDAIDFMKVFKQEGEK